MSAKDILKSIIDDFDILKFEQFFREKNEKLRFFYEDLNINAPDSFSDARKIAEAQFQDGNLIICSLFVKKELTERSGKKAQYEIGKQILKQHQADAGIFIFYDSSGNFRFSLIYTNYLGKRRDWSTFKRFTYFVNKDQTNKTFLLQIGDGDFSTLEKIKEAFSVEKVTKEFYNEIANWYFWAIESCQFPKDAEDKVNGRNTAVIRLITRIIFIWFMRERKLVPKILFDEESIKTILKDIDPEKSTYYHAILQNLFFATLNVKKENREFRNEKRFYKGWNEDFGNQYVFRYHNLFVNPEEIKNYFNDIPFLNGGLFECLDDNKNDIYIDGFTERKKYQPTVPNFLFFSEEKMVNLNKYYGTKGKNYKVYGLFNILSSFNFTIDENSPDDAEIALDPELLGRVFENLLASYNPETSTTARKATGSYYTPREIVDYMVSESLKEYFKTYLDDIDGIDLKLNHLFDVEQKGNPFSTQDTKRIVTLINDLRIVDPAVGSGAFPMGILNKLVFLLSKLDPDNKLWKEIQIKALDKEITDPILKSKLREQALKYFSEKNFDYGRKLYLIQKCIYGVDIQEIAVEITKLRFFISLLVDEKIGENQENWVIEPLPNLDFKIMQGNSLIELLSEGFLCSGVDREREKLTKKLKILKDEMFSPLPSKEKKEKRAEINKLIKQIFNYDRIKKINDFKKEIFGIQSQKVLFDDKILKQKNKAIIDEKQKEIKRLENIKFLNPEEHFEWHINFSEVFEEKGGFDIVIGNPPYIQLQKAYDSKNKYADLYKNENYQTFDRMGDIYCLFYERGIELLKNGGYLAFITSNKWMRAKYGEKLRSFFLNHNPKVLIDLGPNVFESSTVDTSILIIQKSENNHQLRAVAIKENKKENIDFNTYLKEKGVTLKNLSKDAWFIGDNTEQKLKEKIERIGKPLKEWDVKIYRGILTGLNEAFIIDSAKREEILNNCKDENERKRTEAIIKPILRGRDIKRYYYEWKGLWVIFIPWHFPLHKNKFIQGASKEAEKEFNKQYPCLYNYLLKYKEALSKRNKEETGVRYEWYVLQRCAASYYSEFEKEKIVYPEIVRRPQFYYDTEKFYIEATGFVMTGEYIKYICGLLNSKPTSFFFKNYYSGGGLGDKGYRYKKDYLEKLPIPPISSENEPIVKQIETLVDKVLAIAKDKDYLQNPEKQAKVKEHERQIDQLVYKLYNLTPEEIKIVENYE